MNTTFSQFAEHLTDSLLQHHPELSAHPRVPVKVQALESKDKAAILDLTPFAVKTGDDTAARFFGSVNSMAELISAYRAAKKSKPFEDDLPGATRGVSPYANAFLEKIIGDAQRRYSGQQARIIAQWVGELDVYCAVKAVESLLNSQADLRLLEIAKDYNWSVHFDHLAIRCGTKARGDAERVAEMLVREHGYQASQLPEEAYYQFPDGWNAYPVYKVLRNGQFLRCFIDQSDAEDKKQIIQHWNRVYGYTAHHLAMRATRLRDGQREAVPLREVMAALDNTGIKIMEPTGEHTSGLLVQVFTRPEKNETVPPDILQDMRTIDPTLGDTIRNGKLLELVSRLEMETVEAKKLFALYGLKFDPSNPLHSAPYYQYFLPAQAAHVIRTSQEVA